MRANALADLDEIPVTGEGTDFTAAVDQQAARAEVLVATSAFLASGSASFTDARTVLNRGEGWTWPPEPGENVPQLWLVADHTPPSEGRRRPRNATTPARRRR